MHPDAVVEIPLWLLARRDLTPQAKLVWASLSFLLPRHGPALTQPEIGALVGCPDRNLVYPCIVELEAAGLLQVDRQHARPGGGYCHANRYALIGPPGISSGPKISLDNGDAIDKNSSCQGYDHET